MANYREILRLHSLGISNKQISAACHCCQRRNKNAPNAG